LASVEGFVDVCVRTKLPTHIVYALALDSVHDPVLVFLNGFIFA
jgi:hypothetical protein